MTYNFNSTVQVSDTFYIGFRHLDVDQLWISLGLDKNTNTGNKIYANVSGTWVQNQNVVSSLMLRPVFVNEVISAIEDPVEETRVYPNPSGGQVQFEGQFEHIDAFDVLGRPLPIDIKTNGTTHYISFDYVSDQIVLLRLRQKEKQEVIRVLLKRN